jgi:hypothetical protein
MKARRKRGNPNKVKGTRVEREMVKLIEASGYAARRVPLSGSLGGDDSGDVRLDIRGRRLCAEVKARRHGFSQLYQWLLERDILIVKANNRKPLVVLPLTLALELIGEPHGIRSEVVREVSTSSGGSTPPVSVPV